MIRKATISDAQAIKILKDAVWPSDSTSEVHIQAVLNKPEQPILVDEMDSKATGLAAAFMTISQTNVKRWEVDLLAVHPEYQRRGIAKNLVSTITGIGKQQGANFARALIQTENIASQRTFASCGYTTNGEILALYVSDAENNHAIKSIEGCHLIPVSTLNYKGVWIEGALTPEALAQGQAMRTQNRWDIAGAVIPSVNQQAIDAAEASGFSLVSHFQWWVLDF